MQDHNEFDQTILGHVLLLWYT